MLDSIQGKEITQAATGLWLCLVLRDQAGGTAMILDKDATDEGKS